MKTIQDLIFNKPKIPYSKVILSESKDAILCNYVIYLSDIPEYHILNYLIGEKRTLKIIKSFNPYILHNTIRFTCYCTRKPQDKSNLDVAKKITHRKFLRQLAKFRRSLIKTIILLVFKFLFQLKKNTEKQELNIAKLTNEITHLAKMTD